MVQNNEILDHVTVEYLCHLRQQNTGMWQGKCRRKVTACCFTPCFPKTNSHANIDAFILNLKFGKKNQWSRSGVLFWENYRNASNQLQQTLPTYTMGSCRSCLVKYNMRWDHVNLWQCSPYIFLIKSLRSSMRCKGHTMVLNKTMTIVWDNFYFKGKRETIHAFLQMCQLCQ